MNKSQQAIPQHFWNAITKRDSAFDGQFYYGVTSTQVFCRPSCKSRRPLKKNIQIFEHAQQAIEQNYRPCKRCNPLIENSCDENLVKLLEVCRLVEQHSEGVLTTTELAKSVDLSQHQLHRLFKKFLSVTPKNYIDQSRVGLLKKNLRKSPSVTDAIYDSGFESSSVIYGRLNTHLGMTPKSYREGGKNVEISFAIANTALGLVIIGATDKGLCHLQLGDSRHELLEQLVEEYPHANIEPMPDLSADGQSNQTEQLHQNRHVQQFDLWMNALNQYLSGQNALTSIPLDIQGTAFQKKVWDFLRKIPYGEVMSYGEVAEAIGSPKAYRAVATACASNQVGLAIPCHRVIRGDGSMGGYRWGLSRKRTLIELERHSRVKDDE
ncbi:bifunctional DNA-binding transcriptional regulator/O6-methylguanine-DNA methyltransferase Ada [Aliikangiella coralliicola]|nr:bifunctional DNA-binding transcriptional regulator/O6-methylguanine-DNA methyltransferase Ada [Aliikangiella coralliicola]